MRWRNLYPYLLVEMFFFLVLHAVLFGLVLEFGVRVAAVAPYHFVLLGLAVYRGAHIVSNEKITKPLRAPFITTHQNSEGTEVEAPLEHGMRGAVGALLCCPSCSGIWVATLLVYGYLLLPRLFTIAITVLALSAGERFLTMTFDLMKTRMNQSKPHD